MFHSSMIISYDALLCSIAVTTKKCKNFLEINLKKGNVPLVCNHYHACTKDKENLLWSLKLEKWTLEQLNGTANNKS